MDAQQRFNRDMYSIFARSTREVGYKPTIFLQMLDTHGGLEAAKRLLQDPNYANYGFTRLFELRRLDLTVEAHVIKPEYRELFSPAEIEVAMKRLRENGYFAGKE